MTNKLKNLAVTSVDLVNQGANPDAYIRLFKRREQPEEPDPDEGLFKKFIRRIAAGLSGLTNVGDDVENTVDNVEKDAKTFGESLSREQMRHVSGEMFDCCYALSDSFCSILCDSSLDAENKKRLMLQSLNEFAETVHASVGEWANGKNTLNQQSETGIQKSAAQQGAFAKLLDQYNLGDTPETNTETEVIDTMKIDKSKMTPDEQATLMEFEKKYGLPDGSEATENGGSDEPANIGNVGKSAELAAANTIPETPESGLHPEVAKALAEFKELRKQQKSEVEELKKSLEIERLTSFAKKYEALGKNASELAAKLYDLKKAGGTVYDDYVALLDENVTALNKSGIFNEIGSSRQGTAGTEQTLGIKAKEIQKSASGDMTSPEAFIKAWEANPELAAQYEAEYMMR